MRTQQKNRKNDNRTHSHRHQNRHFESHQTKKTHRDLSLDDAKNDAVLSVSRTQKNIELVIGVDICFGVWDVMWVVRLIFVGITGQCDIEGFEYLIGKLFATCSGTFNTIRIVFKVTELPLRSTFYL